MFFTVMVVFHTLVCIGLIIVVLLQSSKGEGLAGSAFGGGGSISNAVFGGRGAASFLSKATTVLAIVFFLNCAALAYMSAGAHSTKGTAAELQSDITQKAQAERERALQQQQAQQNQGQDSLNFEILPNNAPADTSGN